MSRSRLFLLFSLYSCFAGLASAADDWPQWMGPNQDNSWDAENIIRKFPIDGPRELWSAPVAAGYSGPAVSGKYVFLTDFVCSEDHLVSNFQRKEYPGTERVLCLSAETGKEIWSHSYDVTSTVSYSAGPRCTPTVDEGLVYTMGAEGNLFCFESTSGEIVWQRDLRADYDTKSALWGYASHPLIDGEKLICLVGGKGSHTVAFNKKTGEEIWRYGDAPEQGYSPPMILEAAGKRQLILMSPKYIASVDPDSGKPYWTKEYEATSGSIIMKPLQFENYLFVGGYSNRNLMLELQTDTPGAKVLFRDKPKLGLSPVNVQPFLDGNLMYGMDQSGALLAAEIPSGNRLWETGQPLADRPVQSGTAFIVRNKEVFFLFCETGDLVIATMDAKGFKELDRANVIEPTNTAFGRPVAWYPPAFAGGRVFLRNDKKCICLELTEGR